MLYGSIHFWCSHSNEMENLVDTSNFKLTIPYIERREAGIQEWSTTRDESPMAISDLKKWFFF
jgi:hypothetical protein